MGMKINTKKTEVMKVSDDPSPITVTVAGNTQTEVQNERASPHTEITHTQ